MKQLNYLLISMVFLFIGGCAGISNGPVARKADAEEGRMHSMNRDIIPKLVGSWKLISFHSQDSTTNYFTLIGRRLNIDLSEMRS